MQIGRKIFKSHCRVASSFDNDFPAYKCYNIFGDARGQTFFILEEMPSTDCSSLYQSAPGVRLLLYSWSRMPLTVSPARGSRVRLQVQLAMENLLRQLLRVGNADWAANLCIFGPLDDNTWGQ
jgi:hypothetical protein